MHGRIDPSQKLRKAVSALSGPFPPLKGNVVASVAVSRVLNYVCFIYVLLFGPITVLLPFCLLLYITFGCKRSSTA